MCLSDAIIEVGARSSSMDADSTTGSGVRAESRWSSQPPRLFFFFIRNLAGSMFAAITLPIVHVPDVIVCLSVEEGLGLQWRNAKW